MTNLIDCVKEAERLRLEERAQDFLQRLAPEMARALIAADKLAEAVDAHVAHQLDTDKPMPRQLEAALVAYRTSVKVKNDD
jgi:hypothetical protein